MCSKHASTISLGELATLVVEVLSCGDVMEEGPALLRCDETGGEDYGMEGHVVFSHELEQLYLLAYPPVLVRFLQEVRSDRDVPDRGIEPHVENLLLEFFDRHSHTPFQVTSDAFWF